MKTSFLTILLLIPVFGVFAQHDNFMFVDVKGHAGLHLYLTPELSSEIDDHHYWATEVRLGWQTDGSKGWEHNYNYPAFGLGWYSGFIGDRQIFGNPNALYGFIIFPLSQQKRYVWVSEVALGIAYDLNKYDPQLNPVNDAVGSRIAVYFNYNFGGRYRLNERFDIMYGLDITHMSNGRIQQPNLGLNMGGANVGMSYHFTRSDKGKHLVASNSSPIWRVRPECPAYQSDNNKTEEAKKLMYFGIGVTQNRSDKGSDARYFNSSMVFEYQRFFSLKNGATLGVDLFYDGSVRPYMDDPFMAGVHAGYDYRMSRLTMRFQLGTYLYAPEKKGGFFMRPALQYAASDNWFIQLGLKTKNGLVADWLELGVGVRL